MREVHHSLTTNADFKKPRFINKSLGEGFWMDLEGRLIIDVDVHFGIDFYGRVPMAGRRNFLWPLEEISPSRAFTGGVDAQVRF